MYGKMKEHLSNTLAEIKEAGLYKEERLIESAQQAAITVKHKTFTKNWKLLSLTISRRKTPYYMLLVLMLTVVYSSRYLRKKTPSSPIL